MWFRWRSWAGSSTTGSRKPRLPSRAERGHGASSTCRQAAGSSGAEGSGFRRGPKRRRSNTVSQSNQYDRLPGLAADLVRRRVAVIATMGSPAAPGGKGGDRDNSCRLRHRRRPGDAWAGYEPRPGQGGNLTGVTVLGAELGPKRLELAHELVPTASRRRPLTATASTCPGCATEPPFRCRLECALFFVDFSVYRSAFA